MKRITILTILLTIFYPAISVAESVDENAGTYGAQYLKIAVGARPIGMGEAYTAVSDDSFGVFYNPAGTANMKKLDFGVMHNMWLSNITQDVFCLSVPISSNTTVSGGAVFTDMPRIEGADVFGNANGTFIAYNMVAVGSIASKLFDTNFTWGFNYKYIEDVLENERAKGSCYDFGLKYRRPESRLALAGSVQNIGNEMKFVQESFKLPMILKAGLSYTSENNKILTVFDLNKAPDAPLVYCGGIEAVPFTVAALKDATKAKMFLSGTVIRLGYHSRGSLTFGFGLKFSPLFFDYAFVPFENLGGTQRISLRIIFDMPFKEKPAEIRLANAIYGRVTADNKPVDDAVIKVTVRDKQVYRITTKHDGSYIIKNVPTGVYDIKAWKMKYEPKRTTAEVGAWHASEVNFELTGSTPTAYIYGKVTNSKGAPLSAAIVKISFNGKEKMRIVTDDEGNFETPPLLEEGLYEVKVWIESTEHYQIKNCKIKGKEPVSLEFKLKTGRR